MSDCCFGFSTNSTSADRVANPIIRPLNDCGDRANFPANAGDVFAFGTPVKLDADSDHVVPALDGVDAIGLSMTEYAASVAEDPVLVQRTGHIYWSEMAVATGATGDLGAADKLAFLAVRAELQKINLYVEFK